GVSVKRLASGTDALQLIDRVTNVFHCHVARQMRRADPRSHNKADFSTLEFLVERHRFENLFARKIWRQMRRQIEATKKIDNRIALIARQCSSFYRDIASRHNSKTDRFAVKKFLIIAGSLNSVAYGVTKVEDSAFAGAIILVFGYDS